MEIGETLEWDGVTYLVKKKIDEYTYEIQNEENGEVVPYVVGRPTPDAWEE